MGKSSRHGQTHKSGDGLPEGDFDRRRPASRRAVDKADDKEVNSAMGRAWIGMNIGTRAPELPL